jgi:hypothetical protein
MMIFAKALSRDLKSKCVCSARVNKTKSGPLYHTVYDTYHTIITISQGSLSGVISERERERGLAAQLDPL